MPVKSLPALLLICALTAFAAPPTHVYLTWQNDTASTLTVTFHTRGEMPGAFVAHDLVSRGGDVSRYAHQVPARSTRMEGVPNKWVHVAELRDLPPGGDVFFTTGHPEHGFSPERKAKTIPADATRFRFVQGGDIGTSSDVGPLFVAAASFEPDFAALGGDLAYADGALRNAHLWEEWLRLWCTHMVTPKGYTVPMVLAIGNHEVEGGWGRKSEQARFFFRYFPQGFGDAAYGVKRFGRDLALLCLDSDHTAPSDGPQKAWIEKTLKEYAHLRFRMAMYHVPMFPSHRSGDRRSQQLRAHWLPLFDAHGLSCAWENHDHTFKRTHLLKNGKPDPDGTPYFGDGCWGRPARPVDLKLPYLRKAAQIQHYWVCDIFPDHFEARAADAQARVFDVYPEHLADSAAATAIFTQFHSPVSTGPGPLLSAHLPPRVPLLPGLQNTALGDGGFLSSGYLLVDQPGEYRFWRNSNSVLRLELSGFTQDADGQSPVHLDGGVHPILVVRAPGAARDVLGLDWQPPDSVRQAIPEARLYHDAPETRVQRSVLTLTDPEQDGEESTKTGVVNLTSTDLELVRDADDQLVALRFPALPVPPHAFVRAAYLQFSTDEPGDGTCTLTIHSTTDGSPLLAENRNLSQRPLREQAVAWKPAAWVTGESGPAQRSPNLASLLNETVRSDGWSAGQPLVLVLRGSGKRVAVALPQKTAGKPARLFLEWEE